MSVEDNSFILHLEIEFCGQTLGDFLDTIKNIKLEKSDKTLYLKYYISSALFSDILEGVNYLHKQNPQIIHRDLCPDNILFKLEENDRIVVEIADFGLVTIHKYAEQRHAPDVERVRIFRINNYLIQFFSMKYEKNLK